MITDKNIQDILEMLPESYFTAFDIDEALELIYKSFHNMSWDQQAAFLNFIFANWARYKLRDS